MHLFQNFKFDNSSNKEFSKTLTLRINQYFKDNNLSKHGDWRMHLKTLFMISLYIIPFILILAEVTSNFWVFLLFEAMIGMGMAGIGLSVMHDANHGAYSKNKTINNLLGRTILMIGGSDINWKIQHNVLHHTYTNVEGYDEDISPPPFLRFSPKTKYLKIHKYQIFYAWFAYGLMTLMWSTTKDFKQIRRYKKLDLIKTQKANFRKELRLLIVCRVLYFMIFLGLPLLITAYPFWQILLGYFVMHFVCGLFLALIFQSAHVTENSIFVDPEKISKLDHSMMEHQLVTTSNFARKNKILSWFIGGLNYQIEHHLFPNICHIHYPKISEIVKNTALEFNLPYHEIATFRKAMGMHFRMLYQLGRAS